MSAVGGQTMPQAYSAPPKVELGVSGGDPAYGGPLVNPENGQDETGVPAYTGGRDAATNQTLDEYTAAQKLFRLDSSGVPQMDILPAGEDYHHAGGREGKKNFQQAYDPTRAIDAIEANQRAEEGRNEAMSRQIGGERARQTEAMASILANREKYAAQLAQRQQVLDQNVKQYTDNLSNTNAYWQNPGNIVSAIAFSLMPIAGGDPAAGARLINQAVEADFGRRYQAANMHLGELRSNVAAYRQLMGDKQAGDLMAESEARRIAAMDIERIALQFASPASKAKAEAAISDQLMRSAQLKMQSYKILGIHQDPKVVNKLLGGAIRASGADGVGFTPYAGPTDKPSAVAGTGPAGTPTTASSTPGISGTRMAALASNLPELKRQVATGQVDKKTAEEAINAGLQDRVRRMHPGNLPAQQKAMDALRKDAYDGVNKISVAAAKPAKDAAGIRHLAMRLDYLEKVAHEQGRDPQEFMQAGRDLSPGMANSWNEFKLKYGSNPDSPAAKSARNVLLAQQELYQAFARAKTSDTHELFGAALTEKELEQLELSIKNNASFTSMKTWVRRLSEDRQGQIAQALTAGGSPESAILYLAANPGFRSAGLDRAGISQNKAPAGKYVTNPDLIGPTR